MSGPASDARTNVGAVKTMGKLPRCSVCKGSVLELEGQFEVLQPYYSNEPSPAQETAGWCHSSCLVDSPHSATWMKWMLEHFTVCEDTLTLAYSMDGMLFSPLVLMK